METANDTERSAPPEITRPDVKAKKRRAALRNSPRDPDKEDIVRSVDIAVAAAIAAGTGFASAQNADPNLARSLAATCANCHGTNGVSQGGTESLAGMSRAEIVRKMQEFKTGSKPATVMQQLSKGYTDEQIELIAGWFAAQKAPK